MIAKNAEEAAKNVRDTVGAQALDKLIRDTYQPETTFDEKLDLPKKVKDPQVYICTEGFSYAGITGPIQFRRGQEITDKVMITQLLAAGAKIAPYR